MVLLIPAITLYQQITCILIYTYESRYELSRDLSRSYSDMKFLNPIDNK